MNIKIVGDVLDGWEWFSPHILNQIYTGLFLGSLTVIIETVLLKGLLKQGWKQSAKLSLVINGVTVSIGILLRVLFRGL